MKDVYGTDLWFEWNVCLLITDCSTCSYKHTNCGWELVHSTVVLIPVDP